MSALCVTDYQQEIQFFQNLKVILKHQNQILSKPNLYYFHLPSWYVGAAPVGKLTVYLGDLLMLWQNEAIWLNRQVEVTELTDGHSKGRKKLRANLQGLRVINVSGSALSGSNSALAWDEATQCLIKFISPSVFALYASAQQQQVSRPAKGDLQAVSDVDELLTYLDKRCHLSK